MMDEINQIVLGYVLMLIAVFLNYSANNKVGLFFAVVSLGLSYFIEVLRINDKGAQVFIPMSILTILSGVMAFVAYFFGVDQNVFQN